VLQENMADDLRPDFTVFKILTRPGGSFYEHSFLLGETKVPGEPWPASADHLHTVCANSDNETKNVYGMLQIGFEVRFYKHENYQFEEVGGQMHLINDVHNVIACAQRMKANPMPVI
jgi:hypothetical protein